VGVRAPRRRFLTESWWRPFFLAAGWGDLARAKDARRDVVDFSGNGRRFREATSTCGRATRKILIPTSGDVAVANMQNLRIPAQVGAAPGSTDVGHLRVRARAASLRAFMLGALVFGQVGALAACGYYEDDDDDEVFEIDPFEDQAPIGDTSGCGAEFETIGAPGEVRVDRHVLRWATGGGGQGVSETLALTVPNDTRGIAVAAFAEGGEPMVSGIRIGAYDAGNLFGEPSSYTSGHAGLPFDGASLPSGCLEVVIGAYDMRDAGSTVDVYVTSARRPVVDDLIDMNIIRMGGASISEAELAETFSTIHAIFTNAGAPGVADPQVFDIAGPNRVDDDDSDAIAELTSGVVGDDPFAINIYFIDDFISGETYGIAGGIPGTIGVEGAPGSGVILSIDAHRGRDNALDTQILAETIAHEIGHQMGLFHTTEADASAHDPIPDTPECVPTGRFNPDRDELYPEDCVGRGAENLMFWTRGDDPQVVLSNQQAAVLRASPATR